MVLTLDCTVRRDDLEQEAGQTQAAKPGREKRAMKLLREGRNEAAVPASASSQVLRLGDATTDPFPAWGGVGGFCTGE